MQNNDRHEQRGLMRMFEIEMMEEDEIMEGAFHEVQGPV